MHGVQAQAIEVELLEPVHRIVDDEGAGHLAARTVEVDGVTPGRLVLAGEEGGSVAVEIVPLGPEMVVDDVEEYGEAAGVAGLDQSLQLLRTPVGRVGGKEHDTAVAPPPPAGRRAHGH